MKTSTKFHIDCMKWYKNKTATHNYIGRRQIYKTLLQKHGENLFNKIHLIRVILDKIEKQAYVNSIN